MAGIHLLDEETGEYNYPYIKRILPGREIAIVNLTYRIQGLMLSPGNPKKIKGLADLRRPEVIFINRQNIRLAIIMSRTMQHYIQRATYIVAVATYRHGLKNTQVVEIFGGCIIP